MNVREEKLFKNRKIEKKILYREKDLDTQKLTDKKKMSKRDLSYR